MKFSYLLLLSVFLLSFKAHAMDPYEIVEHVYDNNVTYSPGVFHHYKEGDTLSAPPCLPQKARNQKALIYNNLEELKESALYKETTLYKVTPGQDARKHISNTTTWPHCINTKLKMMFDKSPVPWGGSGTMVGPHHVFTCGHCIYDTEKKIWADEILAYPALNGEMAPYGELKVKKAYTFKGWLKGDPDFDMALLLLDHSIGDYTGWGGLLSASDTELSPEEIHITGYPGDKGFKQMWGMGHKIKTMTSEKIFYEHDTQGGQSGCAISIKKYGITFVIGVHTNGCGYKQDYINSLPRNTEFYSSLVNSGVRLSTRKFTDLLLKVISESYALNTNKDSLRIEPNLIPQTQLSDLQAKRELFAVRDSGIDGSITQYNLLCNTMLTYGQTINALSEFIEFYNKREEATKKCKTTSLQLIIKAPSTTSLLKAKSQWTYDCCQGKKQQARFPGRPTEAEAIKEVKADLVESMELYKELFGKPHPRWDEFSKM